MTPDDLPLYIVRAAHVASVREIAIYAGLMLMLGLWCWLDWHGRPRS